ncbi:carbohydrate ABC transporter permease [Microbacterium ulmi]|uniref:Sugar ABC transporter permease n=1 Tax=Microbacterium ulmi TaxID=179095 RepID=A0A7Y2LYK9_9MICO|nr:sugar ABC transporter permease [Microbacterium ulmi]NII68325.1 multiple sugar transport system permease protein [Microbacterium ulmi]NNH03140.1 sugar ABC transporter permease [Microbacterium ulmi]
MTTTAEAPARGRGQPGSPRPRGTGIRGREGLAGWVFVTPVIVILGVFLLLPVVMALWVSFSDWRGRGSPLSGDVSFVGLDNYRAVTVDGGLPTRDFGLSLRNNGWYVVLVVPLQTILALSLALLVSRAATRAVGFFRTAFYFPSITSSVAITVLWMFLFNVNGVVNAVLSWFSVNGPNWFRDPRGLVHIALGATGANAGPDWMTQNRFLGVTWWEWSAGPSVAMFAFILMAVFTTSGTFMLLFLAALQNIGVELGEAGMVDGANAWQRFWHITLPQLRPTLFTVLTLGLISTWQVFDMIFVGSQGDPVKTTLTPAFLSYQAAFENQRWGIGAAISFILFLIIIAFTAFQRWVLRERPVSKRRARLYQVSPKTAVPPVGDAR